MCVEQHFYPLIQPPKLQIIVETDDVICQIVSYFHELQPPRLSVLRKHYLPKGDFGKIKRRFSEIKRRFVDAKTPFFYNQNKISVIQ